MLLEELLVVCDENTIVNVVLNGEVVSRYDGRDSIDEEYNTYIVQNQYIDNNELYIVVY